MNKVVHFEIPADDTERVQAFYKDIFGWNIEKAGEMPYWICKTVECDKNNMPKESGAINGGILKRDEANDPGSKNPMIVINVPSIDDYSKKIESAGGKVLMEKRQVGDMGFYTRFQDTEGNIVGLWENIKKE